MKLHTSPTNEDLTRLAQDILVDLQLGLVGAVKFSTSTKIVVYVSHVEDNQGFTVHIVNRKYPSASFTRGFHRVKCELAEEEVESLVSLLEETGGKFTRFQ